MVVEGVDVDLDVGVVELAGAGWIAAGPDCGLKMGS